MSGTGVEFGLNSPKNPFSRSRDPVINIDRFSANDFNIVSCVLDWKTHNLTGFAYSNIYD